MDEFDVHFDDPRSAGEVKRRFRETLTAPLARNGFELSSETDDSVTFSRSYSWYTLWGRRPLVIVATFKSQAGGTSVTISGAATRKVRAQLEELGA